MHGKCVLFPALKLDYWRYGGGMSTESADIAHEDNDILSQFEALGLDMRALNAVARLELDKPTDVQREAIPPFMRGRDVVATAPTGRVVTTTCQTDIVSLARECAASLKTTFFDQKNSSKLSKSTALKLPLSTCCIRRSS